MHGIKLVGALAEPERGAPARRGVACPECADLEIGAPSPSQCISTSRAMRALQNDECRIPNGEGNPNNE